MLSGVQPTADILVVDDAPANLQVMASLLKGRGYKVRLSPTGRLALQAARQAPPDLILLDVNMPELSGYEVAEELKKDPALRDIPIIFLSALQEANDKVRAFAAGGVDYVTKPFQFEEVEARVRTHLHMRRLQAELEQRNQELTRLQELRDNLTHMIVHDLRSPLSAVVANLDLMQRREHALTPMGVECLADARACSRTVIDMVSSLLDVSRMEAGQLELKRVELDLRAASEEALRALHALNPSTDCEIRAPEQPVLVRADRELVQRVLQNLIGNAFKFTPSGKVQVKVGSDEGAARVDVSDTGPGIAAAHHGRIFEKFGQVNLEGAVRNGTGLGLAFCKLAIEAHGGHIGVESEEGKGATFWFSLPTVAG